MACFEINYNPYNDNSVTVKKNGKLYSKDSLIVSSMNNVSLQRWFDSFDDWNGIGKELDLENNENDCEVLFSGREIDFIDLKDYFTNQYKSDNKTKFTVKANKLIKNDNEVFNKLKNIVERLSGKSKNTISDSDIDISGALDKEQIDSIVQEFERIKNEPFTITVLATMSSGKSTLLNALLHKELLPTGNDATTANIVEILDTDKEGFEAETYDENDNIIDKKQKISLQKITEFNQNKSIKKVNIFCDIPMVKTGDMVLMLRDTPGPNNAQDPSHRIITQKIISPESEDKKSSMSAVIYVMNAENPHVKDDEDLLRKIANEMKQGGKQASERFFFVINKVDCRLDHEHETMEKLLENTKSYLERFEILNPRIFPVTAYLAELVWNKRTEGELKDKRVLKNYKRGVEDFSDESDEKIQFEKHASASQAVKAIIEKKLNEAVKNNNDEEVALIHSGLPTLEESIKEYMQKYAYPTKISDALKEILIQIDDKENREYFLKKISESQEELKKVQKQIDDIKKKKGERENRALKLKKRCEELVLDDEIKKNQKSIIKIEFLKLVEEFREKVGNKDEIKQNEAYKIVEDFKSRVRDLEEDFERRLKREMQSSIYNKAKILFYDLQGYIETIEKDFKVDHFNFSKVSTINKNDFFSIEKAAEKTSRAEDIKKTYRVYNPNYHWWTFWRDKYIYRTKVVGKEYYVNATELMTALTEPLHTFNENVDKFYQDAVEQIDSFKVKFNDNLSTLNSNIEKLTEQLSKTVKEEKNKDNTKKLYQNKLKGLKQLIHEINEIKAI